MAYTMTCDCPNALRYKEVVEQSTQELFEAISPIFEPDLSALVGVTAVS